VSVVLDGPKETSYLLVLDAVKMETQSKASLPDGQVIPIGFHGAVYASL
jgi:carotenoid cleavage dioxygenase-like enzyme